MWNQSGRQRRNMTPWLKLISNCTKQALKPLKPHCNFNHVFADSVTEEGQG